MRKILVIILCLMMGYVYGCGQRPDLLLDSFEGELTIETVDYGAGGGATLAISGYAPAAHGQQALRLEYDLSEGGYLWAARGYGLDVPGAARWSRVPEKISWKSYTGITVWMLGTQSGGKIAFDIKDAGNEMWRFMIDDNFSGWKELSMPFSEFFARSDWQPYNAEKNSVIDFPVRSFQLEPRRPVSGAYVFDAVSLVRR